MVRLTDFTRSAGTPGSRVWLHFWWKIMRTRRVSTNMPAARLRTGNSSCGLYISLYFGLYLCIWARFSKGSHLEPSEYFKWLGPNLRSLSGEEDYHHNAIIFFIAWYAVSRLWRVTRLEWGWSREMEHLLNGSTGFLCCTDNCYATIFKL